LGNLKKVDAQGYDPFFFDVNRGESRFRVPEALSAFRFFETNVSLNK
jgi:hypothetical protein